jgi:hypothetical protein
MKNDGLFVRPPMCVELNADAFDLNSQALWITASCAQQRLLPHCR